MPPPRAVADPNVLVAAAIAPRGVCGRLILAATMRQWTPVACPQVWAELSGVLSREKFRRWITVGEVGKFVATMMAIAEKTADPELPTAQVSADPDDEYLVALAQRETVTALVSGDHHLTDLAHLEPPVMTPAAFLALLDGPDL